jgi:hypothetical protein
VTTFCSALYARNRTMKLVDSTRMLRIELLCAVRSARSTSWMDLGDSPRR